jgi:hypothetical protein
MEVHLTKSQIADLLAGKTVQAFGDTSHQVFVSMMEIHPSSDWAGLAAFDNMRHPLNDEQSDGGAGGIIQGWK